MMKKRTLTMLLALSVAVVAILLPLPVYGRQNGEANSLLNPFLWVEKEKKIERKDKDKREEKINLSERDKELLAHLVFGEARGEPFVGQVAVAAVVLNRLESPQFPDTVEEVIFEPDAFAAVADGQFYLQPDRKAYLAVEAALAGEDPTGGALYYWNPRTATSRWVWSRPVIKVIGRHVFAR